MKASRTDPSVTRRGIGALAGLGGVLMIGASFLTWISTATEDGGNTAIDGWGGISGSSQIAGTNLNDVLDGAGSYRPGLIGLIFGAVTVIAAIVIASIARGPRPHRITAALLVLCGLVAVGWGVFRSIDPGDAGVFDAGEAAAGFGPWLLVLGGVLALLSAVLIFVGVIDPRAFTPGRRGIQPRS
ncbi:MAG: hypothetical protein ABJD68_16680 [Nakamurella sp.]